MDFFVFQLPGRMAHLGILELLGELGESDYWLLLTPDYFWLLLGCTNKSEYTKKRVKEM